MEDNHSFIYIYNHSYRKTREAQFINLFDTKKTDFIKNFNCQILTYKALFIPIFVICFYVSLTYNQDTVKFAYKFH